MACEKLLGVDTFNAINEAKTIAAAQEAVTYYAANGMITNAFVWKTKGKVTYSTRPHTKDETRWVMSNLASGQTHVNVFKC